MKIRLFVALSLPSSVRRALPDPGEGWRRLPETSLHVTLAFLGWMEEDAPARVAAALSASPLPAVGPLALDGAVLLPPRRPRVMAVRLRGELVPLQAEVSDRLAAAGLYEPEARAFLPHVTIGRARGRVGREVPAVPELTFRAGDVVLYRSLLARGGAQYEPLARWPV